MSQSQNALGVGLSGLIGLALDADLPRSVIAETLELALVASGCDNGSSYISSDLAEWLKDRRRPLPSADPGQDRALTQTSQSLRP